MTDDLLIVASIYGALILVVFFILSWLSCCVRTATFCVCENPLSVAAVAPLGADVIVMTGVVIAAVSADYIAEEIAAASAGIGIGAALSILYLFVPRQRRTLVWIAAILRAAAPIYVLSVLDGREFENGVFVLVIITIGSALMALDACFH